MFHFLLKKLRFLNFLMQYAKTDKQSDSDSFNLPPAKLSAGLARNLAQLRNIFNDSSDIQIRQFKLGGKTEAALFFVAGLVDKKIIHESILHSLMYDSRLVYNGNSLARENIVDIQQVMLSVGEIKHTAAVNELVHSILSGYAGLLIDGYTQALLINAKGWETRSVQEPVTEAVVRGPREGFTETIGTNTALLRRKIKSPNLIIETMVLGERTRTDIALGYIKGIVNPALITEIKRRLKRINIDAILESGYIEQFIEDNPFSPFPTIANSEKPDVVAAKILEGRVAILVDGTPIVLTAPMLFVESFQSPEDYYSRPYYVSIVRALRFLAFTVSILGPPVYVALSTFHQELIPTALLITMAAAREGTPFPAVVEAIGMGMVFEILREAGIRLPRPVGQAISIVGALVVGEAAVSAGIITSTMVIVVAFTAISSFVVPAQADVQSLLRIFLVIAAGFIGAYGIGIGLLIILIHLCEIRSFGIPYFSPLAPTIPGDLKDVFVRAPLWAMFKRPESLGPTNNQRQQFRLKPRPPQDKR